MVFGLVVLVSFHVLCIIGIWLILRHDSIFNESDRHRNQLKWKQPSIKTQKVRAISAICGGIAIIDLILGFCMMDVWPDWWVRNTFIVAGISLFIALMLEAIFNNKV